MEEKKYVYVVTTGINGVDDRVEVGRSEYLGDAIKTMNHYRLLLTSQAKSESEQVYYHNTNEFTQFDVQIEKELVDEDGNYLESVDTIYDTTPKFRYGKVVD